MPERKSLLSLLIISLCSLMLFAGCASKDDVDSDGDGIPDASDQCPDTPSGVIVDENGCPLDSDNDGVPDSLDLCPGTPEGMLVDENGCPDSDNDGVPDNLDRCPGTEPGVHVDEFGCAVMTTFNPVSFQLNSSVLDLPAYPELDDLAAHLNSSPDTAILVKGFTCNLGTPEYNLMLAERRAMSVKQYLLNHGVSADQVKTEAMGEAEPVADNSDESGRKLNRRVELVEIDR